jgi:protein-disulfide isomerase
VLEQVLERYPNDVKYVFKHFPLNNHKFARPAAVAALAAERQGKFWEFHDKLYENYNRLNQQKIQDISRELGLDAAKFETDMRDSKFTAMINRDRSEGIRAGVTGTPAVFLNGKLLRNRRLVDFQAAIEKELQKLRAVSKQ